MVVYKLDCQRIREEILNVNNLLADNHEGTLTNITNSKETIIKKNEKNIGGYCVPTRRGSDFNKNCFKI